MDALVSVVVPVYNAQAHLQQCLDSILQQSYSRIEVICVNDGSRDRSGSILDRYMLHDPRVKVIHQKNGGVSKARNNGLTYATGKYVQFVDSDDAIQPGMIRALVNAMEDTKAQLVICGYQEMGENLVVKSPDEALLKDRASFIEVFDVLYRQVMLNSVWNKLYLRELISADFPEGISIGEDLIFNMQYLAGVQRIKIVPRAYYLYRWDDQFSLSGRYHVNAFEAFCVRIESMKRFLGKDAPVVLGKLSGKLYQEYSTCLYNEAKLSGKAPSAIVSSFRSWNRHPLVEQYIKSIPGDDRVLTLIKKEKIR